MVVRCRLGQFGLQAQIDPLRVQVVGQHIHTDHVPHPHDGGVRHRDRRLHALRLGKRNHGDLTIGGPLGVRHRVPQGQRGPPQAGVHHSDHRVTLHGDLHRRLSASRSCGCLHPLNDQDPSPGIGVVGRDVHQHLAPGRKQRGVPDSNRQAGAALRAHHIHADQARRGFSLVRRHVVQVVDARGAGGEADRSGLSVEDGLGVGCGPHIGQTQCPAQWILVIGQRPDDLLLPGHGHHVIGHGHRWLTQAVDHLHLHAPLGCLPTIGDGDGHGACPGGPCSVLEGQLPVGADPHDVRALGHGVDQTDVVTLRVEPVGDHLAGHGLAGPHSQGGHAQLFGRGVDLIGHHSKGDGGTVRTAPSVISRVLEAGGSAGVLRDHDLEGHAVVDPLNLTCSGLRSTEIHCEHIAVGIGVVEQDLQGDGASGTDPELVVHGHRIPVLLLAFRRSGVPGDLLRVLGLLFVFGGGRLDVVPVGDHPHVLGDDPGGALPDVVEDHGGAVGPEDQLRVRRHPRNGLQQVIGIIWAVSEVGAGGGGGRVGAAVHRHGFRGRGTRTGTGLGLGRVGQVGGRELAAVQADRQVGAGAGQGHCGLFRPGRLQAGAAQRLVLQRASGPDQDSFRGIQHDGGPSYSGQLRLLHLPGSGQGRRLCRHQVSTAVLVGDETMQALLVHIHGQHLTLDGGGGQHRTLCGQQRLGPVHGGHRVRAVAEDLAGLGVGGGDCPVAHPETVGGREDRLFGEHHAGGVHARQDAGGRFQQQDLVGLLVELIVRERGGQATVECPGLDVQVSHGIVLGGGDPDPAVVQVHGGALESGVEHSPCHHQATDRGEGRCGTPGPSSGSPSRDAGGALCR